MPNVYRPPQPTASMITSPTRLKALNEAKAGIALEVMRAALDPPYLPQGMTPFCKIKSPKGDYPHPPVVTDRNRHLMVPPLTTACLELRKLVRVCDLAFRLTPHDHPELASCSKFKEFVVPLGGHGGFLEQARCCYKPQWGYSANDNLEEVDLSEALRAISAEVCGYELADNAYGRRGDVARLEWDAKRRYLGSLHQTVAAVNYMVNNNVFGPPGQNGCVVVDSIEDVHTKIAAFASALSQENVVKFQDMLISRAVALKSATTLAQLLKGRVGNYLAERRSCGVCLLTNLPHEMLGLIAQHMNTTTAKNALVTCKTLGCPEVRRRLPHFRVRTVLGSFPHHRTTSRDRATIREGSSKCVIRNFVVAHKTVRVWVDLVEDRLRPVPLKKKPRTDGLSNLDYDFSDDEYEDPPEAKNKRGAFVEPAKEDTKRHLHWLQNEKKHREAWEEADGPVEKPDRHTVCQRINDSKFFATAPTMTAHVVYADTLQLVEGESCSGGLVPSARLAKNDMTFRRTEKWTDPMPAFTAFHIPSLSSAHGNRLFRLKISIVGTLKPRAGASGCASTPSSAVYTTSMYTEPFEVVSRFAVAKGASKRKTLEQARADRQVRYPKKQKPAEPQRGVYHTTQGGPPSPDPTA
jgi:hypothetical protein